MSAFKNELLSSVSDLRSKEVFEQKMGVSVTDVASAVSAAISAIKAVYEFLSAVDWATLSDDCKALYSNCVDLYQTVVEGIESLFSDDNSTTASLAIKVSKMNAAVAALKISKGL